MKLASYKYQNKQNWGIVDTINQLVYPSAEVFGEDCAASLLEHIKANGCDAFTSFDLMEVEGIPFVDVTLLSPIVNPSRNVFCVGKNYIDHIKELEQFDTQQFKLNEERPIFFTKCTTSVMGPYDNIPLHEGITEAVDYEAELAIIIGKEGINIKREDALEHVFGYTVLNDVTARDLQKAHKQWFKGKSLDGFCPMGPWIVTRDEIRDPQNLDISTYVNDEVRQSSNTQNMIFDIATLIEWLSQGITLKPGDILATGTPSGVGLGMYPPQFLKSGDVVQITVQDIGTIKNRVK
ncbi:MAG: fumarylacetoacetate hydrolase family protein [Clostridiales bacterium]|nr:fumarylacetoacetate hydrolase family protein [Clostridiales bacterium]